MFHWSSGSVQGAGNDDLQIHLQKEAAYAVFMTLVDTKQLCSVESGQGWEAFFCSNELRQSGWKSLNAMHRGCVPEGWLLSGTWSDNWWIDQQKSVVQLYSADCTRLHHLSDNTCFMSSLLTWDFHMINSMFVLPHKSTAHRPKVLLPVGIWIDYDMLLCFFILFFCFCLSARPSLQTRLNS